MSKLADLPSYPDLVLGVMLVPEDETVAAIHSAMERCWAMQDELFFDDAAASPIAYLHGYGHYHERYVRIDGTWKFRSVELRRLQVETRPR